MSAKTKSEISATPVAYSEAAVRNNAAVVEYCRTSMAALSGCTAGLLGLTGLIGAIFYICTVTILWIMINVKAGSLFNKYFISRRALFTNGFFGQLFTLGDYRPELKMAHDERNFRSAYYEKVGFRAVEEKKSLEILLKDKPLDKVKLRQFSLRFSVPASYRNLVWKILLGVLPVYCDSHAFIMSERRQEYAELLHALQIMRVVDNQTPKAQVFLAMWMLRTGNLRFNVNLSTEDGFVSIVQAFMQFFDDDADVYWLTKCFYDQKLKFEIEYPKLKDMAWVSLQKHNSGLYNHLVKSNILHNLPVEKWFDCCFAGILSEIALGKIWDKLCGGNFKILAFVVVILLSNQGHNLEKCKDLKSALHFLLNIPEDAGEKIAYESISMWQGQQDKPKS